MKKTRQTESFLSQYWRFYFVHQSINSTNNSFTLSSKIFTIGNKEIFEEFYLFERETEFVSTV